MTERKKLLVLSKPDADSAAGAWMYLQAKKLKPKQVDYLFVPAGSRATLEQIGDREAIHIDTGLIFDGERNFDHHQEGDPRVIKECATSLIYQSFHHVFGDDPVMATISDFVRNVDHAIHGEMAKLLNGLQYAYLLRSLSSRLSALAHIRTNQERVFAAFDDLDGFYDATKREISFAEEIYERQRVELVETEFGLVFFGQTEKNHGELRHFIKHHYSGFLGNLRVEVIIASYGDNSLGVTLLGEKFSWKIDLAKLKQLIAANFPNCVIFLHLNRYVVYIKPKDGNKDGLPTVSDLFDLTRRVYRDSQSR